MTGIILCGGKSSRMGSDKGLLQNKTRTWTEIIAAKFEALQLPFVLSVNKYQSAVYSHLFKKILVIEDNSSLQVFGPLQGILSVYLQQPNEDFFVLACDLPSMGVEPLEKLIELFNDKKHEAFAYMNGNFVEPVCAIYTSAGLQKIYELLINGDLKKHSLHYVLDRLDTFYEPVPPVWEAYFNNYNSPEDLNFMQL